MNINSAAAASIAGTSRAASRGGESDNQATEATRQKSISDKPAGKSPEAAVDAGGQTDDRSGDGRQVLDVFEEREPEDENEPESQSQRNLASPDGTGSNLDLQA